MHGKITGRAQGQTQGIRLEFAVLILTLLTGSIPKAVAFDIACSYGGEVSAAGSSTLLEQLQFMLQHRGHLGLKEDQLSALQDLELSLRKKAVRQLAEITILKLEIEAALHKTTIDVKTIEPLVRQKNEIMLQKELNLIQGWADLKGILSLDQHGLLRELQQDRVLLPQGKASSE